MFSGFNIESLVDIVYHTPLSYIIFYYFLVFVVSSIIENLLAVDFDSLELKINFLKLNKISIFPLLVVAWFGLVHNFVVSISPFGVVVSGLLATLFFVLIIASIKLIIHLISGVLLFLIQKKRNSNLEKNMSVWRKSRRQFYAKERFDMYKYIAL